MSEGPKLYTKKPRKAHPKQFQQQQQQSTPPPSSSASSTMATKPSPPPPPPPPPPQPPQEFVARRFKFLWPLLLTVNVAVGAYIFMRTKKNDTELGEEAAVNIPSTPVSTTAATTASVTKEPLPSPSITEPVKLREPIPENQQRELFKWLLEEKRKVKPRDPEEKKRIDEEKAILKQFIRAKSIPSI